VAPEIRHITKTSLQCLSNNQRAIQQRGQDFDFKKFVFEGVNSREVDIQIS